MMKKIGLILGALVLFLLAAVIVIPLVVDVDKYRPRIVDLANDHLNGKLELGKLSLSLWGQVRVEISGLTLSDAAGKPVLGVKDAYFHLPLSSLLEGSPSLILVMKNPSLEVVKNKAGKLNLLSIAKPSAAPDVAKGAGASPTTPSVTEGSSASISLPGIATRASLGVEMRDALVSYHDETTGIDSQVRDFNILVENVSLSRSASLRVWADLDTKMAGAFSVKGPFELTGSATPSLREGKFDQLHLVMHLDLDKLDIAAADAFHKSAGVAANADLAVTASGKEVQIERLDAKFFNVDLKSSGSVTHLGGSPSSPGTVAPSPVVQYEVSSNDIDLKSWVELVPMLKNFELGGTARFDAKASGPTDKLAYQANAKITGLTAKAPQLKAQPRFDVALDVETDELKSLQFTMKAPGNDLSIQGTMHSFTAPQGHFNVTSSGMDLDQLIDFPPPAPAKKAPDATAGAPAPAPAKGAEPGADLDAKLIPLRENKALAAANIEVPISIKSLKARDVKITDLSVKLGLHQLTAAVEHFTMKLWNGEIGADLLVALKPVHPTYHLSTKVAGLDLREAVSSQLHLFKDTVLGTASFEMVADGSSFDAEPAMRNLKATGKFRVDHAVFASIDVGKMVTDALNSGLQKVAEKVPQAKGKTVPGAPKGDAKYQLISSSFKIADGKFSAPDFVAKAEPNVGIDLKGDTLVGLADDSLQTNWEVIDTYNLTKARDVSVSQGGLNIPHILAHGNDPVKFPISAGCTIVKPCYSYAQVPGALAAVAMANVGDALKGQAGAELKKHALDLLKQAPTQNAPAPVKNAIDDLKKKFF